MGGMIAQELALAAPERVRTLTLGCTYPGGPGSRLTDQATVQRILTSFATSDPEVILRTSFEINVSPAYAARPGAWEAFRENALAVRAPVPVVFEQLRATSAHDANARLGEITAPTLVVHGDLDEVLDVSNGELIARLVPGARLEILHGVGHLFWIEEPGPFGRADPRTTCSRARPRRVSRAPRPAAGARRGRPGGRRRARRGSRR